MEEQHDNPFRRPPQSANSSAPNEPGPGDEPVAGTAAAPDALTGDQAQAQEQSHEPPAPEQDARADSAHALQEPPARAWTGELIDDWGDGDGDTDDSDVDSDDEPDRAKAKAKAKEPPPLIRSVKRRGEETAGGRPGLRELPRDIDDLATGKVERLRRKRPEPAPLDDTREGAVIPGVRNTEARAVYDARVARLRHSMESGRDGELAEGLFEVQQLQLWRARNVTDLQAFAESVVGLPPGALDALLERGAAAWPASSSTAPDHVVALLIRSEAALLQRKPFGSARLRPSEPAGSINLELSIPAGDVAKAVESLTDLGQSADGLRRFLRPEVGDRGAWRSSGGDRERRSGGSDRDRGPVSRRPDAGYRDRDASPRFARDRDANRPEPRFRDRNADQGPSRRDANRPEARTRDRSPEQGFSRRDAQPTGARAHERSAGPGSSRDAANPGELASAESRGEALAPHVALGSERSSPDAHDARESARTQREELGAHESAADRGDATDAGGDREPAASRREPSNDDDGPGYEEESQAARAADDREATEWRAESGSDLEPAGDWRQLVRGAEHGEEVSGDKANPPESTPAAERPLKRPREQRNAVAEAGEPGSGDERSEAARETSRGRDERERESGEFARAGEHRAHPQRGAGSENRERDRARAGGRFAGGNDRQGGDRLARSGGRDDRGAGNRFARGNDREAGNRFAGGAGRDDRGTGNRFANSGARDDRAGGNRFARGGGRDDSKRTDGFSGGRADRAPSRDEQPRFDDRTRDRNQRGPARFDNDRARPERPFPKREGGFSRGPKRDYGTTANDERAAHQAKRYPDQTGSQRDADPAKRGYGDKTRDDRTPYPAKRAYANQARDDRGPVKRGFSGKPRDDRSQGAPYRGKRNDNASGPRGGGSFAQSRSGGGGGYDPKRGGKPPFPKRPKHKKR